MAIVRPGGVAADVPHPLEAVLTGSPGVNLREVGRA